MVVKSVALCGAAVHTRETQSGQDYDWYVKAGDMQLFDKIEEIYRIALRDISGEVPKLAVIIHEQRIGFLIGDMPSKRMDHGKRVIYDTLYLEFDLLFSRCVLHAAAVLLLCSKHAYQPHEQHFTLYAEEFFSNLPETQLLQKTVKLPIVNKQPNFNLAPIHQKKLALFSDPINRNRCARHLIQFTPSGNSGFSFISTGRLKLEKCQKIAEKSQESLFLTLSSEVQSEINLNKGKFYLRKFFVKR